MSPADAVPSRPGPLNGRLSRRWLAAAVIAIVVVFLVVDPPWTVENIQPPVKSAATKSANFSPSDYVDKHWTSQILPTVMHRAVDLTALLGDLKRDPSTAGKKFGHFATLGGEPTFVVKGSAHVLSVNTSGIPATATLAGAVGGHPVAQMQLGPILTGTDVRDAMPFLNLNQFTDQVTFGELATAINQKIDETALSKIDNKKLTGKTVRFYGAFTYTPGTKPLITPVKLNVSG